jgi:hypothetical protein
MYVGTILIFIAIKYLNKYNSIRFIFIVAVPLLFIAIFNIYVRLILNEIFLKFLNLEILWIRNILNSLICNLCCFMMKKLVAL